MEAKHTSILTSHASKYLQQLCKHWAHRLDVTFDAHAGKVQFDKVVGSQASAAFTATGERLEITLQASNAAALAMVTKAVEDHLRRFAFREELSIAWSEAIESR